MDKTGWPIPQKIQASWDTATEEARAGMHSLSKMKTRFEEAGEKQIVHFREVIITGAVVACKSLYSDWKNVLPFAVCPVCSGKVAHTCSMCKGRGYVSEFFWSRCVTKEMKDLRAKISAKQGK